jgi:hypothetical protein
MRPIFLLVAAILTSGSTAAQDTAPSSTRQPPSTQEDASGGNLPVSLDRIREALSQPPGPPLLSGLERTPDFKIEVEERRTLIEIFSGVDFKTGPAPPGGLYGYEQQRRLFNPVTDPLAQPYAAFNSAELLTIAIENLMIEYLGGRLLNAVTAAERAQAEQAARDEVTRAISAYCAAQPNRGQGLRICTR